MPTFRENPHLTDYISFQSPTLAHRIPRRTRSRGRRRYTTEIPHNRQGRQGHDLDSNPQRPGTHIIFTHLAFLTWLMTGPQIVYIPGMAINTARRLWGEDALEFDPYRWLTPGRMPPQSELTAGINGHYTFTEGPRLCVGYRLGQISTPRHVPRLSWADILLSSDVRAQGYPQRIGPELRAQPRSRGRHRHRRCCHDPDLRRR